MKKIKIIIIEDNNLMIETIKNAIVDDYNIEIIGIAKDGKEGLKLIDSLHPDIAVLDLILPEIDGFEILSKVNRSMLNTKFLIVSSLNDDYFIKKALLLGASYFVVKPYNKKILKERIYDLINDEKFVGQKEIENISSTKQEKIEIKKPVNANSTYLDEKISDILLSIGIPANIIGFEILKEAIILSIDEPDLVHSITKGLYPELAKRLNNTVHGVERAIRHAIDTSWNKGRIENINAILGVHVFSKNDKPTNSEFIAMLSRKLTSKC